MIKRVTLGEELVITVKNKIGLMAEISEMLANRGINIESALGYESGKSAKLMLVTTANIAIIRDLKKKYSSVKENEVVMVELEDKPGAMKVVTMELKKARIDITYLYVTSPTHPGGSSRMVVQTSDNEKAMALLSKYTNQQE